MTLALNLGKSLEEMEAMPVAHLSLWQKYTQKKVLPWRKLEYYMANLCRVVAQSIGGNAELTMADFMLDVDDEDEAEATGPATAEEARQFFGFNPRVKD